MFGFLTNPTLSTIYNKSGTAGVCVCDILEIAEKICVRLNKHVIEIYTKWKLFHRILSMPIDHKIVFINNYSSQ